MKIKIFAAPGDNRDDFGQVEAQANEWLADLKGDVVSFSTGVVQMPPPASTGKFLLTLTILYREV